MPESWEHAAVNADSESDEFHLLLEDDLETSEDFDKYSFSDEPVDAFKELTSAQKVEKLDLNAMGALKRGLPRYLFRAYGPTSGGASPEGQYKDLNSEAAITPHAFHKVNGLITGHKSASEIPNPRVMIDGHLGASVSIRSEFSSWSPSLLLVLCYAEQKYGKLRGSHVCVIDTYKIRNGVYHVPNIIHIGLASKGRRRIFPKARWEPYPEEYLVHNIVSGEGFVAIPYDSVRADLVTVYPEIPNNWCWGTDIRDEKFDPESRPAKITETHIELLIGIARRFNTPTLIYPLTVSLICLVKRFDLSYTAQQLLQSPEFAFYAERLRTIVAHMDLSEQWLVNDLQYTGYMLEVKHTKMMMRALVRSKYGRGRRVAVRDLAAQLESTHIQGEQ